MSNPNQKSIQFLRGTLEKKTKSIEVLQPGQPLIIKDTNQLIIGKDGTTLIKDETPITVEKLNKFNNDGELIGALQFGEGDFSIEFPQLNDSFTYKSSNIEYTYETATTGKNALNLSSFGRITRNGYALVGNYNAVEYDANNKLDADDGGIIAGYKNYTNARGSSIFGAHNRLLDTKNSFILGYQNAIKGTLGNTDLTNSERKNGSGQEIIIGSKNYMENSSRQSSMIGYGLKNLGTSGWQYIFGTWNKPGTQQDKLRFIIGNGTENFIYQDVQLGRPDIYKKPELEDCIKINESLKYNPNKEGWRYIKVDNSYQLITSTTSQTDFDNSLVYQYINAGRSNAFQVTSDGRAQLFQKEVDGAFVEKGDNDLLVKKEIESTIDIKINQIDLTNYTTVEDVNNIIDNKINFEKLDSNFFNSLY